MPKVGKTRAGNETLFKSAAQPFALESGSKLHAVQTLARAPKLPDFAERLDCVKLASALPGFARRF